MPGVYISYPFCAQKCTYCNFASGVFPRELESRYIETLRSELRNTNWPWTPETVYLGGGTPSQLDPDALTALLAEVPGNPWIEATIEVAPGTITPTKARSWQRAGINRVSLGVQSFITLELARTGRKHTAEIVGSDVATLREAGIDSISIDLIAGLPGQTRQSWRTSLDWLEKCAVPHASVYMLEVDEDSRLGREILAFGSRYGASDVPSDDHIAEFYEIAVERLGQIGLARYEISNFARPGFESRHNLKYWRREPYLGFGADAHSFDGTWRWQNAESAAEYVEHPNPLDRTLADPLSERFFLGLRLSEGINADWAPFSEAIRRFIHDGLLESDGRRLKLTDRGVLLSNEVFAEFVGVPRLIDLRLIDLRSDTVTQPTPAMRRAMAEAEVGDDVYGEDPTINRLERRAAEILGKEAALFLPTGTMANTIAIKLHSEPGQEVICDHRSHLIDLELAMTSWYSNCQMRPIITADGIMRWSEIEAAIRPFSTSWPQTAVINIEHPHNMQGGTLYELEDLDTICDGAHERGVKVHLDGARIFNAVAATGETAARIAAKADTVMVSLSKGLAAPVGSMLAGTAEAIERGRVHRRRLGGGMRQAGVLGAAALVALEDMRERLPEDHANARYLAEQLHGIPGIDIDLTKVRTNILVFDILRTRLTFAEFSARLKSRGALVSTPDGIRVRAVTHLDVTRKDCERAVEIVRDALIT